MNEVLIIGRPNVGKSTLFNAIIKSRMAIVYDKPGTTRDLIKHEVIWAGKRFLLVDSAGFDPAKDLLTSSIRSQILNAINNAKVVLFVIDLSRGVTTWDLEIKKYLKKVACPIIVVGNKADKQRLPDAIYDLEKLGYGPPVLVSASQKNGIETLLDEISVHLDDSVNEGDDVNQEADQEIKIAIVGKPNAGKSSLFNALLGTPRSLVYELPGTTRDSISEAIVNNFGNFVVLDTAGLRKKSKVKISLEYYANKRALNVIRLADCSLLVIDSTEGITHQDLTIFQYAETYKKPVLLILNKWDLLNSEQKENLLDSIKDSFHFRTDIPYLAVSAKTHRNIDAIFEMVVTIYAQYTKKIPTNSLNRFLRELLVANPLKNAKVKFISQVDIKPPTLIVFATSKMPSNWVSYLENNIRKQFGLTLVPIRIHIRVQ